ncbi:MAG: Fe-S oxidoreductase, partial [Cyclobacteriaceae bacterium]|nr:Fe-S oxidoreductase [Cyclobacteriaceae bacterium]
MILFQQILFFFVVAVAAYFFFGRIFQIRKNILLGQDEDRGDQPNKRWRAMVLVAFGQKKMFKKPIPALLHLLIYVGFIVINIEGIEFFLDGVTGNHRTIAGILEKWNMTKFYTATLNTFEFLAVGVILSCVFFLIRRNVF